MSSNIPLSTSNMAAPTPQNTPMPSAPISQGLSRPTVPDIDEEKLGEHDEDDEDEDEDEDHVAAGGAATQQAILKLVQGRLAGLLGKSSGYIESLPVEVRRTIEALKGVQVDFEKLQNEFKKDMLKLEEQYLAKYQPLFDRRASLVAGKSKPTPREILAGEEVSAKDAAEDDEEYTPLPPGSEGDKPAGIPDFWLTALRNHPGLADLITDRDALAISHLVDITAAYGTSVGRLGYTLTFHFEPNQFFENSELVKIYIYKEELTFRGDIMYEKAIGTTIKWKGDNILTKTVEIRKQRNKNTNRTRLVRELRSTDSFFNFFSPPQPSNPDEKGNEEDDEEDENEERMALDFQIGEDLKDRIIPRAVDYFTGKALEFDGFDDLDVDDDVDEEDEDED